MTNNDRIWRERRQDAAAFAMELMQQLPAAARRIPRNPDEIAQAWGITVIRYPLADSAGMLVRTATDAWIVVSTMDPETRQRFTVAHELGHYFYDTVHANDTRLWVEEMEANAFAAALLVPPDDLRRLAHPRTLSRWAVDDHDNGRVQRLAARYGVSVAVVVQSLVDAGMVRGVQPWTPPSIVWTNWTRLTAAVAATATGSPWESWAVTSNGSAAHV